MSAERGETADWLAAYHSEELVRRRLKTYRRKLRRLGALEPGQRTLDIACGSGEALRALSAAGAGPLYGIDLFAPPAAAPEPFYRALGDGTCLPFCSGAFERVLCMHALHHFRSFARIEALLAESRRVLAPGGRLLLVDHFDSAHLRLLFRALEWRCPFFPASARHFGEQLRQEHDLVFWWLAHWRELFAALARTRFQVSSFRRGLFFFYLRAIAA